MHIAYLTDNINKVARQSKEAKDRRRSGAPGRVESWKKIDGRGGVHEIIRFFCLVFSSFWSFGLFGLFGFSGLFSLFGTSVSS